MAQLFDKAPELPPPFVNVSGIANFRDIGGYNTSATTITSSDTTNKPSSVRRNLVYRCADPSKVQPSGVAKLKELGIRKVFDLRSVPEIQREGPEWAGVPVDANVFITRDEGESNNEGPLPEGEIERVWCPVFRNQDYGPEQVALRFKNYAMAGSEGFVQAYKDIMANGPTAYKTVLSHLAQENPEPCIVHCTAGKDRTGVICAIIYLLCGVPKETVAQEYSLTDKGLEHLIPLFTERLLKNPALEGNPEGVRNMVSSQPEKMARTIEMMEVVYGGAERYVREVVGLNEEEIERLRKNLVVDEAPIF